MNDDARKESERLAFAWQRHSASFLDHYLTADVEDPRINAQSILMRALLVDSLFPGQHSALIDQEFAFGLSLTWIIQQRKAGVERSDLAEHLELGANLPAFVRELQAYLNEQDELPDYLWEALSLPLEGDSLLPERPFQTFRDLWREALADAEPAIPSPSVLELACGSANDFRVWAEHGLANFVSYSGMDIAPKNIENARRRFPEIDFRVGNAMSIALPDDSVPFVLAQDLFEHLSLLAMEQSLAEIARVCSGEAWLGFFNLADIPDHQARPTEYYHWNMLSLPRIIGSMEALGGEIEVISIPLMMGEKFGYWEYYNKEAITLVVRFRKS